MVVSRVSVPHDDASVWLTNLHVQNCVVISKQLTCTKLCGCWSDEKAMCENYGKDDTETDNNSNDEEEAVDGYDVL